MRVFALFLLLFISFPYDIYGISEFPPQSHAGNDLTLEDGDIIWGVHSQIGTLFISEGSRAYIKSFDGVSTSTGMVEITADHMIIEGALIADGAGYSGGSGGGGGAGTTQTFTFPFPTFQTGMSGQPGTVPYEKEDIQGMGRIGGTGDGPGGGLGGYRPGNLSDEDALDGSYISPNHDKLGQDLKTWMGSGGGGGGGGEGLVGYNEGALGGGGGGAGGRGGGAIRLFATGSFKLGEAARVTASGQRGGNGKPRGYYINGCDGGNVEPEEEGEPSYNGYYNGGGYGGSGSGGSILIHISGEEPLLDLNKNARVVSLGGGGNLSNGGGVIMRGIDSSLISPEMIVAQYSSVLEFSSVTQWVLY